METHSRRSLDNKDSSIANEYEVRVRSRHHNYNTICDSDLMDITQEPRVSIGGNQQVRFHIVEDNSKRSNPDYICLISDSSDNQLPTWKTYLYQLQNEAPKPKLLKCTKDQPNRPTYYGDEYHGLILREEAEDILAQGGDGSYLVRRSDRAPQAFTLAIRFDNQTKNYKLYYDGLHYVGEKRFETVEQLVEDGLIHFYIESRAADYIASLSDTSNYAQSPYLAYSVKKKRLQKSRKNAAHHRVDASQLVTGQQELVSSTTDLDEEDGTDMDVDVSIFEKPHVFKTQNFIGLHWCDFCANFMWGLIAQGSKCQDCGFEAHKKCSERVPNDCMPDIKFVKSIFGADLTTVIKALKTPLPLVVERCVKEIESRGMEAEGLYRVAGLHDDVEEIRMSFDRDCEKADITSGKYEDINTITSVLKLYFRLLPIPLITFESYRKIIQGMNQESKKDKVTFLREGLAMLPPAHYQTLKYLVNHLVRVSEHKAKNMMTTDNLAIVFAPTLMRSPDSDPMLNLMSVGAEQKAVEMLLSCNKELFLK
ncbi:N-chimaerin-like isoform X2 [Mya arenaria]|uniref:N-chimaerin-like isoform X2 n=1 Tax=Mya arenaria TaxID=6604 RepID=UPI0022E13C63|nr:N-chimaerin-like isoform X2 [Mya arenaria]